MGATIKRANIILGEQWGDGKVNPMYLGISITPIKKDGTGIKEPNIGVGGYSRIAIANTSGSGGNFSAPNNLQVSNSKEFSFPPFTGDLSVTGMSGPLNATYWFISSSETSTDANTIEWYGKLKAQRPLVADAVLSIGVGDLVLRAVVTDEDESA